MRNILTTAVGALALMLSLAGCDAVQQLLAPESIDGTEATDTIKIGFLASGSRLTYPNGGEIAVSEINANGGLLGMPLELVTEVGILTPDAAVEAASRMIHHDGVCRAGRPQPIRPGYPGRGARAEISDPHDYDYGNESSPDKLKRVRFHGIFHGCVSRRCHGAFCGR